MTSERQRFFEAKSFAVIGHSEKMPFPRLTFQGLLDSGRKVFAIDPSPQAPRLGQPVYHDWASIPEPVEAAILELPKGETAEWVRVLTASGVRAIWIHEDTESPEALQIGRSAGATLFTGTCAVMYLMPRKFPHSLHRWIQTWRGKY